MLLPSGVRASRVGQLLLVLAAAVEVVIMVVQRILPICRVRPLLLLLLRRLIADAAAARAMGTRLLPLAGTIRSLAG